MANASGVRFGPYEILSPLGSGGMGEVYRAKNTKLRRDGAITMLPDALRSAEKTVGPATESPARSMVLASASRPPAFPRTTAADFLPPPTGR